MHEINLILLLIILVLIVGVTYLVAEVQKARFDARTLRTRLKFFKREIGETVEYIVAREDASAAIKVAASQINKILDTYKEEQ